MKEEGAGFFNRGEFQEALDKFKQALLYLEEQESDLITKLNSNVGICHMKILQFQEAIQYFDNSLAENPLFVKARVNRAVCYFKVGDHKNAMNDFEEIKKTDPDLLNEKLYEKCKTECEKEAEKQKEQMMGELKNLGNKLLGNFGLSLDNFKLNPDGKGGYNISYQNN